MTDTDQTAAEKKLAEDFKKDFTRKPGYAYRLKVVGGETRVIVTKLGK